MKRVLFSLLLLTSVTAAAQKKKTDILKTSNIKEIENFLATAHPDDPRRSVLKPKLIALKNTAWTQGAKHAKPMAARPIVAEIPNSVIRRPNSSEAEEFTQLMTEASAAHKDRTVKLLNTLFDQDINRKEAILLIQNNSDCNMIVRIQGKKFYNIAIASKTENSVVLEKGNYQINSNVCDVKYSSSKSIDNNMIVMLNNPVTQVVNKNLANKQSGNSSSKFSSQK